MCVVCWPVRQQTLVSGGAVSQTQAVWMECAWPAFLHADPHLLWVDCCPNPTCALATVSCVGDDMC